MTPDQRAQIRLILEDVNDVFERGVDEGLKALYAANAARGLLKSGATIKTALRTLEKLASDLIASSIDRVTAVAKDVEAFAVLHENAERVLNSLDPRIDGIVSMGTGKAASVVQQTAQFRSAKLLWADTLIRLRRQIEIHRFTFTQPSNSILGNSTAVSSFQSPNTRAPKNPGGKPLAAHWDEMWSTLAVNLYTGDLQPRSQADIEAAIKDWFLANNLEIGDTAARERARQLWTKYQKSV